MITADEPADDAEQEAEDEEVWSQWRERRDAELATLERDGECVHGAPTYSCCVDCDGEYKWCEECGSLGSYAEEADAGHQIDLPNESGRGPGWIWSDHQGLGKRHG